MKDDTRYRSPREQLEELPLFAPLPNPYAHGLTVRVGDDSTAQAAARSAEESGRGGRQREAVARFALERDEEGFIRSDVDEALELTPQASSARIGELLALGVLVKTPRTRRGASGHAQRVLVHRKFAKRAV